MLQQQAGETRARGVAERGRTFGNIVAGAGQAVGNELAARPVRQRRKWSATTPTMNQADINAERGEMGLEADRMALGAKMQQAQARAGGPRDNYRTPSRKTLHKT